MQLGVFCEVLNQVVRFVDALDDLILDQRVVCGLNGRSWLRRNGLTWDLRLQFVSGDLVLFAVAELLEPVLGDADDLPRIPFPLDPTNDQEALRVGSHVIAPYWWNDLDRGLALHAFHDARAEVVLKRNNTCDPARRRRTTPPTVYQTFR